MFLTDAELLELTGYVRNADRCKWLKSRGWKFERNAITGRPVVLRTHVEEMLSLTVTKKAPIKPEPRLNLDAIQRKPK